MAGHLNRADLLNDPDFATREDRKTNRLRLRAELETVLTTKPAAEWEAELNGIGVPAGAVLSVPEVLAHDHIRQRGLFGLFEDVPGVAEPIDLLRVGMMMDGKRPSVGTPPPALGQDTDDVLGDHGYSSEDIRKLRKEGVV